MSDPIDDAHVDDPAEVLPDEKPPWCHICNAWHAPMDCDRDTPSITGLAQNR